MIIIICKQEQNLKMKNLTQRKHEMEESDYENSK